MGRATPSAGNVIASDSPEPPPSLTRRYKGRGGNVSLGTSAPTINPTFGGLVKQNPVGRKAKRGR